MPQWVFDTTDFSKGIASSNEDRGFFSDTRGIDLYNIDEYESQSDLNALGTIRAGFSATDFGGAGVTDIIRQFITAYDNSGDVQYVFGFGDDGAYRVNTTTDAAPTKLTTVTGSDKGATLYTNGTDTRVYVAGLVTITDIGTDIFGTMTHNDPTTTGTPIKMTTGVPHPLFVKNTILWGGDKDELFQLDDTTWTDSVLDLDKDYTIQSLSEYDRYLAIGAMFGNSSSRVTKSRVYFWDMFNPDTWNFSADLDGAIVQLKNSGGVLYALTSLSGGFALWVFNGTSFRQITSKYTPIALTTTDVLGSTVFDIDRGQFYWNVKDTELETRFQITDQNTLIDVWSFNNAQGMPATLNKPFDVLKSTNASIALGGLIVGAPDKVYVSYQDDTDEKLVVMKSGNTTNAFWRTVELDRYLGGSGRLKRLNWIRFDVDRLASSDVLEVYKAFEYNADFTRMDGGSSAAATNSIRELDFSGENRSSIKFTRSDTFRQFRLGAAHTGGDVRIRRIVIDFDFLE